MAGEEAEGREVVLYDEDYESADFMYVKCKRALLFKLANLKRSACFR